ncbi:hypothetical protein, partial [Pseudomonas veronii]|uniref:hypothetical protein n=1 Tax=Pseudomonas veronii TaxID=76761 RepID=UPI001CC1EB58
MNEIEPDFINSCRTATGQNVAFVNLNGALDINKPRKRGFFALKKGFQSPVMHQQENSYRVEACPNAGRSELAREKR